MAISKFLEFSFFMFIGNCVYFIKSSSKGNNGFKKFVYDPSVYTQIICHISSHLLSSFGGTAVIFLRAYKQQQLTS
jgi:hypothetical protein